MVTMLRSMGVIVITGSSTSPSGASIGFTQRAILQGVLSA
jgi:hypothetical protein